MAKKKDALPTLSEAQLEILNVIWKRGEATVGEVWSELTERRPIARNTVQTVIVRLEDKGWLKHRAEGNTFLYRATQPAHAVRRKMTRRLVETLFHGSTEGLLLALFEKESLSPEEAQRMRTLIDQATRRQP
jgi:BlaI family transcriptional regulator, penicillinase repressor